MKNLKRLFASVMVIGMLATMGVSALACSQTQDNMEVQPYGAPCLDCGIGEMKKVYIDYTEWVVVDYIKCICNGIGNPDPSRLDKKMERTVVTTYECTNCGLSTQLTGTETKTEHYK